MDYSQQSVAELRRQCADRNIGSGAWRVGASKSALIQALETGAVPSNSAPDLAAMIGAAVSQYVSPSIDEERVTEMIQSALSGRPNQIIEVRQEGKSPVVIGRQHFMFPELLKIISARRNVWIYGPAGSGKTSAVEAVAKALELPYYAQSVCAQTSKNDFFGYIDANGKYVRTLFREAYENGGVFLIDEIDAGNPNVLVVLNAALANGKCGFPDGMIHRHKDFILCAAANTIGNGADRQFVGRNQIDGATLNRFVRINWRYDEAAESEWSGNAEFAGKVQALRAIADRLKLRVIISPRASIDGAALLQVGFSENEVLQMTVFEGLDSDTVTKLKGAA